MFLHYWLPLCVHLTMIWVVVVMVVTLLVLKFPNFARTRWKPIIGSLCANRHFSDELILALVDLPP